MQEESCGGVKPSSARSLVRSVSTVHKILRNILRNILTKLVMCRSYFLLTYQQERILLYNFLLAWKCTKNGLGNFCGQTKLISFCQNILIHRITEYEQKKIHLKLKLYYFILQKSLCGTVLRYHLSQVHISSTRRVL